MLFLHGINIHQSFPTIQTKVFKIMVIISQLNDVKKIKSYLYYE